MFALFLLLKYCVINIQVLSMIFFNFIINLLGLISVVGGPGARV